MLGIDVRACVASLLLFACSVDSSSDGGEQADDGSGGSDSGGASAGSSMDNGAVTTGRATDCVPQCGNRECGPDPQCGESCGACDAGLDCVAGECRSPTTLRENGDTCSTDAECASGFCAESTVGELHCYGNGGPNDICSDTYDCAGGVCIARSLSGAGNACVEGVVICTEEGVSGECTLFVVAFCQLVQFCGSDVSSELPEDLKDFDFCVADGCIAAADGELTLTPAECLASEDYIRSGQAPCP